MNYLKSEEVFVPITRVNSLITYQIVRKPTVFEKSILQLLFKYRDELGEFTIEQIARNLKLFPSFFTKSFIDLINLDVITSSHGIRLPENALLKEFELTSEGANFLAKNELPSKDINKEEKSNYNPMTGKLCEESSSLKLDSEKFIDEHAFNVELDNIQGLISDYVYQKLQNKNQNHHIKSVNSEIRDTVWGKRTIDLSFDQNGNLSINSKSKDLQGWLDSTQKDLIWETCINKLFNNELTAPLSFDWKQIKDVFITNKTNVSDQKDVTLNIKLDKAIKSNRPQVVLHTECEIRLEKNILFLPVSLFSIEPGFKELSLSKNKKVEVFYEGKFFIYYGGQTKSVDLCVKVNSNDLWHSVSQQLLKLEEIAVIIFSSLLDLNQAVERLPDGNIQIINEYCIQLIGITPNFENIKLLNKVETLTSIADMKLFNQLFPNKEISIEFLSKDCFSELIEFSLTNRSKITLLELTQPLHQLSKAYFSIIDKIDTRFIKDGNTRGIKADSRLLRMIEAWKKALSTFTEQLPDMLTHCVNTNLKVQQLLDLEKYIFSNYAKERIDNNRVVVIDTNCLMHNLGILDNIKEADHIIIPHVVLQELDGLKQNNHSGSKEISSKARKAINRLNSISSPEHYEHEQPQLLISSQEPSSDQKILSIAIYHRINNGILLTDDKNLKNLATSENVKTETTKTYLNQSGK